MELVQAGEEIAAPPGLDGRTNNRHQEPAAIKFNPIPDVAGSESWRSNVRDTIVAAAGGSMEAYLWILEVEDPSLDFEHLSDVGIFQSIDAKIADAVSKIQRGVIAKQLTMMKTQAARNKTLVSGRQQLRFIYDEFKLDEDNGERFDLEDLMKIRYPGDDQLEEFLVLWDGTLTRMDESPSDKLKRSVFHGSMG